MIGPFDSIPVCDLNDAQRDFIASMFGSAVLPPSSTVAYKSGYLVIEHFDLAEWLDHNPDAAVTLDARLIASDGTRMHFPVS